MLGWGHVKWTLPSAALPRVSKCPEHLWQMMKNRVEVSAVDQRGRRATREVLFDQPTESSISPKRE